LKLINRSSTKCVGDFSSLEIDGIFGFGPGPNSFVSQVSSTGIAPPIFSHCLKGEGNGGLKGVDCVFFSFLFAGGNGSSL